MKVFIHGGGKEVGRACFEIHTKTSKFLFDSGVRITEEGLEYPLNFNLSVLDAVFLAHSHLDHCGALPMFHYRGLRSPVYCTKMTKTLAAMMLKDSWKVGRIKEHVSIYTQENLKGAIDLLKTVEYKKKNNFNSGSFVLSDAGHIPGSATVVVNIDGKTIVYSGDLNTQDTYLLGPTSPPVKNPDLLIIESTYGGHEHPNRKDEQNRFKKIVKETIAKGGKVIIPSFAIGRAQEVAMVLYNCKVPLYMDGMAKGVATKLVHGHPSVKDQAFLEKVMRSVVYVKGIKDRMKIIEGGPAVIITTSGMVTGGPVIDYLHHLYKDKDSAILLVGYQGEGTNGRLMYETGRAYIEGMKVKVHCKIDKFDFSGHAGMADLHTYIKTMNPKNVILHHGDEENINTLNEWLNKNGVKSFAPDNGDELEF